MTTPPTDPAATARGLVERQIAMLTRLAEIGMEVAEAAGVRARALAEAGAAAADGADPALSFARVARAVRLTLALQSRLADSLAALDRAEAIERVGEAGRRRHRVCRRIEEAAEAEGADAVEIERLSAGAWERLTDTDDEDLLALPVEEVVARILRDLGLPPAFAAPAFEADPFDVAAFAAEPFAPGPAPDDPAAGPAPPSARRPVTLPAGGADDRRLVRGRAPPASAAPAREARLHEPIAAHGS